MANCVLRGSLNSIDHIIVFMLLYVINQIRTKNYNCLEDMLTSRMTTYVEICSEMEDKKNLKNEFNLYKIK